MLKHLRESVWVAALSIFTILALGTTVQQLSAATQPTDAAKSQQEALWKPTKPIMLIVPSRPGGGHDVTARVFAKYAEKYAGRPITIINEDQGAGVIAYTKVLQSKPDGYTIGQMSVSLVSDQYLVKGVKYNQDSFIPICQIAADPNCLVIKKGSPYDMSLEDFINEAKKNPKKIRMGVSGNWTNHDYVREQLEMATGAKFQRVSIKGGAQIVMSILAGDLDAGVPYPSEIRGHVDGGDLKILAQSGSQRLDIWPNVPTFKEKGVNVDLTVWRVLAVPKDTPENVVKGLYDIFNKAMNDPGLKQMYKDSAIGHVFKDPRETVELIRVAHDRIKEIIDRAGLMK